MIEHHTYFARVTPTSIGSHTSTSKQSLLTKVCLSPSNQPSNLATQLLDGEHARRIQQGNLVYTIKPSYSLFPFARGSKRTMTIYEIEGT
jgi:hypothetical protein